MVLKSQKKPARVFLNDRDSWVYREDGISEEERGKLATLRSAALPLAVREKRLGFISLWPQAVRGTLYLLTRASAEVCRRADGAGSGKREPMQTVADEVAHRERLNCEVEIAARYKSGSSRKNCPPSAALIMHVIAALRWEWAAITTISLPCLMDSWASPLAMCRAKELLLH